MMIKHAKAWGPSHLRRVTIKEVHKTGEYLVADDGPSLVSLAQMGIVEVHTWNGRAEEPYIHDRVVLDVDPSASVRWPAVVAAALRLRALLKERGLESWVKTTGGRGLHVVVPIAPTKWETCLAFTRALADTLVAEAPDLYTVAMPKAGREAKILLDMLRNNRANTSVAAYSVRARRGAPVSMPLDWNELVPTLDPASLTLGSIGGRLASADPWAKFWKVRQRLR
jgi:bifunctional non-homologous end joining protein LigD